MQKLDKGGGVIYDNYSGGLGADSLTLGRQ